MTACVTVQPQAVARCCTDACVYMYLQPLAEPNTNLLQLAEYTVLGFLWQIGAYMWFFD